MGKVLSDYIWTPDNPKFNYFTDIPPSIRHKDPFLELVRVFQLHPQWAAKTLIGSGDFGFLDFQYPVFDILWNTPFPLLVCSRGFGKTFVLAMYALLRAALSQNKTSGEKIVLIGASFRQSKLIFDEIIHFFNMSPLLQECSHSIKYATDHYQLTLGNSTIIALPLGTGEKIRGIRATITIVDEFAQINEDIFDTVVRGFSIVSQNPAEKVREIAKMRKLIEQGLMTEDQMNISGKKNQIIIASTAFYEFNHLYRTYLQYLNIINSKIIGSTRDHKDVFGNDTKDTYIDYRDFSIVKIPYTELPEGYLDATQVAQAQVTMGEQKFAMEYLAEFISDTDGFFKARAIQKCTPSFIDNDGQKIIDPNAFTVEIEYDGSSLYVMGIDPARSSDNFAIYVLKIQNGKIKCVFCKSFNNKNYIKIAETVRELIKCFNIQAIGIDKGGGGQTFADILADPDLCKDYPRIFDKDEDKYEKQPGLHIIELINYQGEWLRNANYDLQADFDNERVLFPYAVISDKYSIEDVHYKGSKVEEIDEAWLEIQESKDEVCSIVTTSTGKSENIHFDLPAISSNPLYVRRKDRYSALLLGSDQARKIIFEGTVSLSNQDKYGDMGGWIEEFQKGSH